VKIQKHILIIWVIGLLSMGMLLIASFADGFHINLTDDDVFVPYALSYLIVGGLIASRHPENAIGWFLLAGLFALSVNEFMIWYVHMGLQMPTGSLPAVDVFAALTNAMEYIGYTLLLIFPFLLFPNGRLFSRRWLPILWLAWFAIILELLEFFRPGPLDKFQDWENPLGIEQLAGYYEISGILIDLLMAALFIICLILLILRYRGATMVERQQIKWFAFAASIVFVGIIITLILIDIPPFVEAVIGLSIYSSLVLAYAIAILRYNLWDIDLIIRRTLQYAMLTGLLAFVYFGSVLVLRALIETITGDQSPIDIVLSTLAIAALFNPLRHRIQTFIDRRFYRGKYDAARSLAQFANVARNEVDMETLIASMLAIVDETVHPEKISLWLTKYEET
jgi:hypothetical protein